MGRTDQVLTGGSHWRFPLLRSIDHNMKAVLALLLVCLVQISFAEQENIDDGTSSETNLLLQREVREAAKGCKRGDRKCERQAKRKEKKKNRKRLRKEKNRKKDKPRNAKKTTTKRGKKGGKKGRKAGKKKSTRKGKGGKNQRKQS